MKDLRRPEGVEYFGGVDTAPSESARSDDGAIVVLQARPKNLEELTNVVSDWQVNVVYARRVRKDVRGTEKGFSAREWAGMIHRIDEMFGVERWMMDPNGGGIFVMREMASSKTIIDGVERLVTPIVTPDNSDVAVARYSLGLFKRGDTFIEQVWQNMGGDEVLNHHAYQDLKNAMDTGIIGFPPPYDEWPREVVDAWPEEKKITLRVLTLLQKQLNDFNVQTGPDGVPVVGKRGAFVFGSTGKKDMVSGLLMAWVAFVTWLQGMEDMMERETTQLGCFGAVRDN